MRSIIVIKTFVFSYLPTPDARVPRERVFATGPKGTPKQYDLEDNDPFFEHEWIKNTLADGAIEHPDKTKLRLETEAAVKKKIQDDADRFNREAQATFERAQGQGQRAVAESEKAAQGINTPLPQAQVMSGADIAANPELNTPVSVLRGGAPVSVGASAFRSPAQTSADLHESLIPNRMTAGEDAITRYGAVP